MTGQQVACPHCNSAVLIESPADESSHERHHGVQPPVSDERSVFEAPPAEEMSAGAGDDAALDPASLYPPGFGPAGKTPAPRTSEPSPAATTENSAPEAKGFDVDRHLPPAASVAQQAGSPVDNLLPPEATAGAAGVDSTAGTAGVSETGRMGETGRMEETRGRDETGGRPAVAGTAGVAETFPVPSEFGWPEATESAKPGPMVIPTEDGSQVTLREPTRTVGHGEEAREVPRRTPRDRGRRRLVRNLILWTIGTLVLIAAVWILRWLGPL